MKLNPETPKPLQLPPTGEPMPNNDISVSLIQILDGRLANVITGNGFTVSVAALEVTEEQVFVTITLYWLPVNAVVTEGNISDELLAFAILLQVLPPLVLICHW